MEENSSLFSLTIDPVTKANLYETAKWARLLAIVGLIFLVIMIISGVLVSITLNRVSVADVVNGIMDATGPSVAMLYIIFAIIGFFPLLYTLRFANQMRGALNANNQALLNASFQNLKRCLRYVGILTLISLVLMVLSIVFGMAGLALS
jgi:hypothetical protein